MADTTAEEERKMYIATHEFDLYNEEEFEYYLKNRSSEFGIRTNVEDLAWWFWYMSDTHVALSSSCEYEPDDDCNCTFVEY